ncbi:MAG: hypothetical protein HYS98_03695 [Deltaproteobacteria bacterium]|nr:hypothetical protein [Deltaproteobacteria bacterium]
MNKKIYFLISGIIFSTVCVLHLFRVGLGWSFEIGSYQIPTWISIMAVVFTAYLALTAFKHFKS